MTPDALLAHIDESMLALADAGFAQGQRRFFQHEVDTYGVRTQHLTMLVREVYAAVKTWPLAHRNALMKGLWETGKLESGVLVCHVYRRFARQCTACEFKLFERWIDRYVHNWAHTDGVSSWLLAACIENEPDLRFALKPWTASKNRWKRRASAVSLLQEAKAGRHTDYIFEITALLLPDRDDMVEKGVGWLLKETYPQRPVETLDFLLRHETAATRLTLRYAAEKMTPEHRKSLLASH
ncbi:DNA alkylation repair protein [uncultured Paludibaculum sp.]|uniref:DNA alkylation repair protein n=1 Tax=uncultured Paludibaculum sp. TaxID=1765020 RepID=UPI002AAB5669|nr:DNA alkylation repair protein [uncultured Paludibaculum sp.]